MPILQLHALVMLHCSAWSSCFLSRCIISDSAVLDIWSAMAEAGCSLGRLCDAVDGGQEAPLTWGDALCVDVLLDKDQRDFDLWEPTQSAFIAQLALASESPESSGVEWWLEAVLWKSEENENTRLAGSRGECSREFSDTTGGPWSFKIGLGVMLGG